MKNRNYKIFALPLAAILLSLICLSASPAWAAPAGKLITWGNNDFGQTNAPPGDDFVAISARDVHALALRSDGSLAGWGSNYGIAELGSADILYGQATVPPGNDFKAIAAGSFHSLALRANGSLVAWGANESGQTNVSAGNGFVAIAAGDWHSLALKSDGSLAGWGGRDFVLNGMPIEVDVGQADVPAGNDFVAVASGDFHGLALKSDGSIVAWGDDEYRQVRDVPRGTNFVAIAAGWKYGLALKSDGSMVGWGANGAAAAKPQPGTNFVAIAGGLNHSLALKSDGSMVGWGSNYGFDNTAGIYYGQAVPQAGTNFIAIVAAALFNLAIQAQPPALTIGQIGNNVVASWPTNHSGYTLEAKSDLSSSLNWSTIRGTPTIVGNQFVLTNSVTSGSQFFRLKR